MNYDNKLGHVFYDKVFNVFRTLRGSTCYHIDEFLPVFSAGTKFYDDAKSHAILYADGRLIEGTLEVIAPYRVENDLVEIDINNIALYADFDFELTAWKVKERKWTQHTKL